ncbi:hypothetical protein Tco_1324524, partial [Tanacetum coccineum]
KQPAQGLETLSEIALSEAEQMKIALERSKIQQHNSHASSSGVDEGAGVKPWVLDVPSYDSEDEEISWKSSDGEGDDDFTTHDEEDKEEESFDLRVHTPSHYESTDDEAYDEVAQSGNAEEEKMDEEQTNEEAEVDTLYRDVNVNLEGRETEMTDAPRTIVQTTQVIEETHVIITLVNPEDVPVMAIAEPPLLSATTLPPPPTPLITHLQQTPIPTPATIPSSSLQDLSNFGSLFGRQDDHDEDKEPSAGSNWGSKRRRAGKEHESTTQAEELMHISEVLEEPTHQEFEIGVTEDQPVDEIGHPSDWFQKPTRLPSPDHDWNKTLPTDHGPVQPWLSNLAWDEAGPTFELMKGTCKSLVELEYFFEEVYKETTKKLDWNNPEGQQYTHDLRKPLPLIPNSGGHQVIPFDHFINNDLAYLCVGVSS